MRGERRSTGRSSVSVTVRDWPMGRAEEGACVPAAAKEVSELLAMTRRLRSMLGKRRRTHPRQRGRS